MLQQNRTGQSTESTVRKQLEARGLVARKPPRDVGVDLEVFHPSRPDRVVTVQVKGRGPVQSNGRYRWFQIRSTPAQRAATVAAGKPVHESYLLKIDKCDFFVLVAEKYDECWVFPSGEMREIADYNWPVYGKRRDNQAGIQREIDLDIEVEGRPLTQRYAARCNDFSPIVAYCLQA